MKVFSKIIDEETKELDCIVCGDIPFEGYSELEREQAYNGKWYLAGYAPAKPQDEIIAEQKKKLMAQLDTLDLKCIRALRAIKSGMGTEEDMAKLAELEEQAEDLRQQLKDL